jgi:hypothetical protein
VLIYRNVPTTLSLPDVTPHHNLKALTDKLADATSIASDTPKGKQWLQSLSKKIEDLLHPLSAQEEQRVADEMHMCIQEEEQRVIDGTPIITIPCITNLTTIMKTRNPTAKWALKKNVPTTLSLPDMSPHQHLKALMDKLADAAATASGTPKGKLWLQSLSQKIEDLLHPLPSQEEQRVADEM